ncbi:hypothetical protein JHK85_048237 [Glycine max]|nr:hypothetical protein JHK85_048237 [Glycine max]
MKEINKNIDYYYYTMSPTGLPTWSPTTEQVMILEELYRNGIRTTSASTKLDSSHDTRISWFNKRWSLLKTGEEN